MEATNIILLTVALATLAIVIFGVLRREFRVQEGQAGLLFRYGKFVRTLEPGRTVLIGLGYTVEIVEMRARSFVVAGQEVVTAEGVPIRVSGIVRYSVEDPLEAHLAAADAYTELYQLVQMALREAVFDKTVEQLMGERFEVSEKIVEGLRAFGSDLGLDIDGVAIRDIVLGGELKRAMSDKLKARLEAQASVERARGEAATMRSLANTAKLVEKSPALMQLRMLQAIESGNATVVIGADATVKVPTKTD